MNAVFWLVDKRGINIWRHTTFTKKEYTFKIWRIYMGILYVIFIITSINVIFLDIKQFKIYHMTPLKRQSQWTVLRLIII
jgi:hypothetical protein